MITAAAGKTQLLVLQASPFCNIDCDYCYLPQRADSRRMTNGTIQAAIRWVYQSGLANRRLTVVWHAGEPLALPIPWYEEAFRSCSTQVWGDSALSHAMQSNGTLINDSWCDFFTRYKVRVGISLDGPAAIHDRHRRDRRGQGTHARAMKGVRFLQDRGIDFHVICVVTADSLDAAEEIMDFFEDAGIRDLGFNVDEQEAARRYSSLTGEPNLRGRYQRFITQVLSRAEHHCPNMTVREHRNILAALLRPDFNSSSGNDENEPFRIVTVLCDGRLSTFSPELAGSDCGEYRDFSFGNVNTDSFESVCSSELFQRVTKEIAVGVAACHSECQYFRLCRGGAPANKFAETGRLSTTETQHCRLAQQAVADAVLGKLRASLRIRSASDRRKKSVLAMLSRAHD